MKNSYKIAAVFIFGLFFFVNIISLHDGHDWGDDFAQYIQHAINLVKHQPYASGISHDLRIICPPGFPLLLSPMIYWFGINLKSFKFLNILFWALGALVAYALTLRWLGVFWAGVITVWFLTSPVFFFFKQSVLSDIPFMCFVLMSIWAFVKSEEYQEKKLKDSSRVFLLASVFLMNYAFLIRWAGISLFLGAVLYLFVVKRDFKRPWIFILAAAAAWFFAFRLGCFSLGFVDQRSTYLLQNCVLISWNNLGLTFQNLLGLFIYHNQFFSRLITSSNFIVVNCLIGLLFGGIIGIALYRIFQRKISFLGCFTFFYLIGLILWPIYGGERYFLPLMVPAAIYLIKCLKPVWRKLAIFFFACLILQNVYVIASDFSYNNDDIDNKQTLDMFWWVEHNIKPEDNYMFARPRALGLFTQRIGYSFGAYQEDTRNWYRRILPLHIKYLIVNKGFNTFSPYDNFHLQFDKVNLYINLVWKNGLYRIFVVRYSANEKPNL